jgi:hypothetical protein
LAASVFCFGRPQDQHQRLTLAAVIRAGSGIAVALDDAPDAGLLSRRKQSVEGREDELALSFDRGFTLSRSKASEGRISRPVGGIPSSLLCKQFGDRRLL